MGKKEKQTNKQKAEAIKTFKIFLKSEKKKELHFREFPGGPGFRMQHFHSHGWPGFIPWLGN